MSRRYELTDQEWEQIASLLPPEKTRKPGRPAKGKWIDDGILDNIFRVLSLEAALDELSLDATIVQAHQPSAGAKKGGLLTKLGTAAEEPVPKSM